MFDALISGIISIAEVCIGLVELLFDLVMYFVSMVINRPNFFNLKFILQEIISGVFIGIKTIVTGIVDIQLPISGPN